MLNQYNPSLIAGVGLTLLLGMILEILRCWIQLSKLQQKIDTLATRDRNVSDDYNRVRGEMEIMRKWLDQELDSMGGWKNEALFWRLHFNKEAALETEQLDKI